MNRFFVWPFISVVALLVSGFAGRPVLADGKRVALVVGVEHYDPNIFSPLRFAEDDALGLEKVLTEIEFDVISDQVLTAKGNRTSPLDPRIQQGSRLQFTLDDAGQVTQGGSTRHERRASENKPPRT